MSSSARFASVVLDVDSTVAGIEGIDWLAALRGAEVATQCADLTRQAMDGTIPLEAVYGERLRLIAPTAAEIERLSEAYVSSIAEGCAEAISDMQAAGVRVLLISGGLRQALMPLSHAI